MDTSMLLYLLGAVGSGGIVYGSVKVALNGTIARVIKIETAQKEHDEKDDKIHLETVDRLARIETKLDSILEKT